MRLLPATCLILSLVHVPALLTTPPLVNVYLGLHCCISSPAFETFTWGWVGTKQRTTLNWRDYSCVMTSLACCKIQLYIEIIVYLLLPPNLITINPNKHIKLNKLIKPKLPNFDNTISMME